MPQIDCRRCRHRPGCQQLHHPPAMMPCPARRSALPGLATVVQPSPIQVRICLPVKTYISVRLHLLQHWCGHVPSFCTCPDCVPLWPHVGI